jgi:malate dehydrogenase
MLGKDQPVSLVLLDMPAVKTVLEGVRMEIYDCAYPLVNEVIIPENFKEGFKAVDVAMLVGASPRGPGMERADLLKKNAEIFIEQGKIIDEVASQQCKILVVGNPANTNALIGSHYAKRIPKDNWTAMSRLDHDRGLGQLRLKSGCPLHTIQRFCVWGNHSPTMFPDITYCQINGKPAVDVVGK